jgi:hypothetical protein
MSLTLVAKKHKISRASVCRLMKEAEREAQAKVVLSPRERRLAEQPIVLKNAT